jgi:hypothetical protein
MRMIDLGLMPVIDGRLVRGTECGARDADFVVAGGERWEA